MKTMLNEWLDHFDLNPALLSEKTGISQKLILKWVSGESSLPLSSAARISDVLGITIDNLVNTHPSDFKGEFSEYHVIETKDFKIASRVQNYLKGEDIPHEVMVVLMDKKDPCFIIRYNAKYPIEPKKVMEISKKRKYKDVRERIRPENIEDKYAGMSICQL